MTKMFGSILFIVISLDLSLEWERNRCPTNSEICGLPYKYTVLRKNWTLWKTKYQLDESEVINLETGAMYPATESCIELKRKCISVTDVDIIGAISKPYPRPCKVEIWDRPENGSRRSFYMFAVDNNYMFIGTCTITSQKGNLANVLIFAKAGIKVDENAIRKKLDDNFLNLDEFRGKAVKDEINHVLFVSINILIIVLKQLDY